MPRRLSQLLFTAAIVAAAGAVQAYSGEQYVTCDLNPDGDNFLALRSCPKSSCQMLEKLGPDTFLITTEPEFQNGWREVIVIDGLQDYSYAGTMGWVYGKYICEIRYPK